MRPGQNKRMRGRNPGRKGPNPLTRSYESNGPDVKIRGTPQHVAEKYLQLARDAQSSGDPVMAESYLQHAEHYFRIIAAAHQAQQQAQMGGPRRSRTIRPLRFGRRAVAAAARLHRAELPAAAGESRRPAAALWRAPALQ
jgi:hypothetical protein